MSSRNGCRRGRRAYTLTPSTLRSDRAEAIVDQRNEDDRLAERLEREGVAISIFGDAIYDCDGWRDI